MRFRPCIDIHNGKVKQIVGSSLQDAGDKATENFSSSKGADFYSRMYREMGLSGGHIIMLNPVESPYYESTKRQAMAALSATPGLLQIGGGITSDNAKEFLDAGASHVIVTSFAFKNGKINKTNLKKLVRAVGKEHIVLDLSCKAALVDKDGKPVERETTDISDKNIKYFVVTDRWQRMTSVELCRENLDDLAQYCDEFLIHAADVEGKQNGVEENVVKILGDWGRIPVTYAGGVHVIEDIGIVKKLGANRVDITVGSALDIFGGNLSLGEVIKTCN